MRPSSAASSRSIGRSVRNASSASLVSACVSSRLRMSINDRPMSVGIRMNRSVARGVKRLMRIASSTNTTAMSVDAIRFCRSSLICAVSSTLTLSS